MPSVSSEIIAEISTHMAKRGGDISVWCVGTARDWHSPILDAHLREEQDAGGAYIAFCAMCAISVNERRR